MRKLIFLLYLACLSINSHAQLYRQSEGNPDVFLSARHSAIQRKKIILPEVNGYKVYTADLHSHTIYSDGKVTPELRVKEAWLDGLDILAVSEHLQSVKLEKLMVNYMDEYITAGGVKVDVKSITSYPEDRHFKTDRNYSIKLAKAAAKKQGLTIIPAVEIASNVDAVMHYNALFITDANTIYTLDPKQTIINARKQGALIMHNHPGWRRPDMQMVDSSRNMYEENLIDGVETMNGISFYPKAVDWAEEYGLFVASCSDVHETIYHSFGPGEILRNMTLIFANDTTPESLKEALLARRTLAYSLGTLTGTEQLLKDFFKASTSIQVHNKKSKGMRMVSVRNNTSISHVLNHEGELIDLKPFESITLAVKKSENLKFTVETMWYSSKGHPVIEYQL